VGCACCHIPKNNSATRFKPKDRPVKDERPNRTRSRRPRPFAIEYRWTSHLFGTSEWTTWKKYRTERERDEALRALQRNRPWSTFRAA